MPEEQMTATACMRLNGHSAAVCRCRTEDGFMPCPQEALGGVLTPTYPPTAYSQVQAQPVPRPAVLKVYTGGYTGSVCDACGSLRMRRSGTCETCCDCGAAGGCG
jgi:hypothetical protein